MIHILAICAAILGFGCLCAAMARHQKDMLGRTLPFPVQQQFRKAAFTLLLVALVIDMTGLGTAYGAIVWFGHLTVGAMMVLAILKWKTA